MRVALPLCVALIAAAPLPASAAIIHVDDDAPSDPGPGSAYVSDPLEDGTAAHPFDSVQEGVDAALPGDTVFVAAGLFTGPGNAHITLDGKPITVQGTGTETIIDLLSEDGGFIFDADESRATRLRNLTIRNGLGLAPSSGGVAIRITGASSPMIIDCRIESCRVLTDTPTAGGAVLILGSGSPRFESCTFAHNELEAASTGTLALGGAAVHALLATPEFVACDFESNSVVTSREGYGGAIWQEHAPLHLAHCTFRNNAVLVGHRAHGGAVWCVERGGIVTQCIFEENEATADIVGHDDSRGGALVALDAVISDCRFVGNSSSGFVGASSQNNTHLRCWFEANTANFGGALGHAWGMAEEPIRIENCVFVRNVARGVCVTDKGETECFGGTGAAIDSSNQALTIVQSTFIDNIGSQDLGPSIGGSIFSTAAENTIVNCIMRGGVPDELPEITNSVVLYSNITGFGDRPTVIDLDPHFVDPANDDFRLAAGSPCIDAGSSLVTMLSDVDHDGAPRFVDDPATPDTGEGDAPLPDFGAFEFQGRASCPADLDASGAVTFDDLLLVLAAWGPCSECPEDLDGDGSVGFDDVIQLLSNWGPC